MGRGVVRSRGVVNDCINVHALVFLRMTSCFLKGTTTQLYMLGVVLYVGNVYKCMCLKDFLKK
jgi:hypothetical protein